MSVVGGVIKLVFCEGEDESSPDKLASLDKRLLSRLLVGRPPTAVIIPVGGKQQMRGFIRGRLAAPDTTQSYLALRDRDFDAEPPTTVSLIQFRSGQPIYMCHRAAIENYLIDSTLIHKYWTESSKGPAWQHGDSPGEDTIRSWITQAASDIAKYQAIRWSLATLKPADRWPEMSTTWTKGSGHLPNSLDERECNEQAKKLIYAFKEETTKVSETVFVQHYARFSEQFAVPQFIEQGSYLVWFHGKDLKKAMQKLRLNSISLDHFCDWAVENLEWRQHPDLQDLAAKL